MKKNAFTLIELVVVLIILGVIASFAMPRFFKLVEFSKSKEALETLSLLKHAMERCYLVDHNYETCDTLSILDIEDPGSNVNARFTYSISDISPQEFTLTAQRNTFEGGDNSSTITLTQDGIKSGTGIYAGIK